MNVENNLTIHEASHKSGLPYEKIMDLIKQRAIFAQPIRHGKRTIWVISPAALPLLRKLNRERLERIHQIKLKIGRAGHVFKEC